MTRQILIDDTLLQQTLQLTQATSEREAVENVLRFFIQTKAQTLADFFQNSPLYGLDIDLERDLDTGRESV